MNKWDSRFMQMAHVIAQWTSCNTPGRAIGCVIVKNKRIVTTGYNGAPAGIKTCVERGEYLRDKLRLTAVVANELEIMDGKFTGNVIGDIVDAQYKAKTLTRLAQEYEIPLAQTVAIGDGANDLPMIKACTDALQTFPDKEYFILYGFKQLTQRL